MAFFLASPFFCYLIHYGIHSHTYCQRNWPAWLIAAVFSLCSSPSAWTDNFFLLYFLLSSFRHMNRTEHQDIFIFVVVCVCVYGGAIKTRCEVALLNTLSPCFQGGFANVASIAGAACTSGASCAIFAPSTPSPAVSTATMWPETRPSSSSTGHSSTDSRLASFGAVSFLQILARNLIAGPQFILVYCLSALWQWYYVSSPNLLLLLNFFMLAFINAYLRLSFLQVHSL